MNDFDVPPVIELEIDRIKTFSLRQIFQFVEGRARQEGCIVSTPRRFALEEIGDDRYRVTVAVQRVTEASSV